MSNGKWPRKITVGHASVTVYRNAEPCTASGWIYVMAWRTPTGRKREKFADQDAALREARTKAAQLSAGRVEGANMSTGDRDELQAARSLAGAVPVLSALEEWQNAKKLCGGHLMEAARLWREQNAGATLPDITVQDAVTRFIAAKRKAGVDVEASYLRQLPYFAEAFKGQLLRNLSVTALQAHLDTIPHPVSRETRRRTVVTMFRWARRIGILPQQLQTNAERTDRPRIENPVVGIVTPEQLRAAYRLIHTKARHYIPALTLAALCGMRRAEVHGQDWSDIDLERRFVRVSRAKRGTPQRRLVPLNDAAVAWLVPHRKAKGSICQNFAIDRIRDICRTASLDLADNGFRHGWISARVAVDGDVARVALDAGNSPSVIHRFYREVMRPDEGSDYLAVGPDILDGETAEATAAKKAVGHA